MKGNQMKCNQMKGNQMKCNQMKCNQMKCNQMLLGQVFQAMSLLTSVSSGQIYQSNAGLVSSQCVATKSRKRQA